MGKRVTGRIVMSVLTVLFGLLCVIYAIRCSDMDSLDSGLRAFSWGILALTSATFYRYFED